MVSISNAQDLYIADRETQSVYLIPDSTGIPTLVNLDQIVLSTVYLGIEFSASQLSQAAERLKAAEFLFVPVQSADGPPYRSGFIFARQPDRHGMPWRDEHKSHSNARLRHFGATTISGPFQWITDSRSGRGGYFVTGSSGRASLWRLFRLEADTFGRTLLTLAPVLFSSQCPTADFSHVTEELLRQELVSLYEDFCQRVVGAAYRDIPTKARNIVEALVAYKLRSQCKTAEGELGKDLKSIKKMLEHDSTRPSCGWTDLEYHLAHKIRLVHGQTHPDSVVESGRLVRPEFALSVVQDLVELLRIWGFVA